LPPSGLFFFFRFGPTSIAPALSGEVYLSADGVKAGTLAAINVLEGE
jgi:hypothetical protein